MAIFKSFCVIVTFVLGVQSSSNQVSPVSEPLPSLMKEVEDNSRYKTLEANATLLKLLVDNKDGVSRSEVFDMLHSQDDVKENMDLPTFPEDTEAARVIIPALPDLQAELLQSPRAEGSNSESQSRENYVEPVGLAAGIMILITCSLVCLAYTSLIVWRRIYFEISKRSTTSRNLPIITTTLKRNGLKHELLRNEENIAETRIEL